MVSALADQSIAPLFEPLRLSNGLNLRNRIIMGPITRNRAVSPLSNPPYTPNAFDTSNVVPVANVFMEEYYRKRARGGAGLIITEGTLVSRQGTQWENAPGLWSDLQIEGWKRVVNAVHKEGAPIFAQLWHVGRLAHPDMLEQIRAGVPVPAPSAVPAAGGRFHLLPGKPGYQTPTPIEDPEAFVDMYRQGAIRAKAAGFDGVDIQGSGGYLIQQFLDSTVNKRTDSWGGSVANRARFALSVVKSCIEVYGDSKSVAIKLMPQGGFNDVGMPESETRETYGYLVKELDKLDIGYIHLLRTSEEFQNASNSLARATMYDAVGHFSPLIKNTKLFINGSVTVDEAKKWLTASSRIADAVVFSQNWVNNPDLVNRLQHGLALDTASFPWQNIYSWSASPGEGYSDLVPLGGLVDSDGKQSV